MGVVVTAGEPSIRTGSDLPAPSVTDSPTAVVASVDTPAESTMPASTDPTSSSTAAETSPAGQAADVAGTPIRLAEVAERAARALAELDSFRAVATITQRTEPAEETQPAEVSTRTNTISLFGDGRMWASTDTRRGPAERAARVRRSLPPCGSETSGTAPPCPRPPDHPPDT